METIYSACGPTIIQCTWPESLLGYFDYTRSGLYLNEWGDTYICHIGCLFGRDLYFYLLNMAISVVMVM